MTQLTPPRHVNFYREKDRTKGFREPVKGTAIAMYVSQMDVVHFVVLDENRELNDVMISNIKTMYNA